MKAVPNGESKTIKSSHHLFPWRYNLLSNAKSTSDICKDVIDIDIMWRFSFQAKRINSSKLNPESIQQLNNLLFDECPRNGFKFIDNGAVSEIDLWTDGIHTIESGKLIIANNFIISLNYFLEFMNLVSRYR